MTKIDFVNGGQPAINDTNLNQMQDNIEDAINDVFSKIHPIGSIYMSVNNVSPATIYGGTWERIAKGRTLVGVDENDEDFEIAQMTGGEKTHTLTESELAPHKHNMSPPDSSQNIGENWEATGRWVDTTTAGLVSWTESAGGGQPHNNLQPYLTCYMWKRTA